MKLKSITSQSFINLKNYKPFYYFNTESRLNKLDKDTMIKVNGITHYIFNGKDSKATPVAVELEDLVIDEIKEINSEDFIADYETVL